MSIYDFNVVDYKGNNISMKEFTGKVLLIVNTATGCGFTPQYSGLQQLYSEFNSKGFEILDFPCNQFGNQAPGGDIEISEFCSLNYNTTFPRFKKIDVNGENADPLFKFLKDQKKGLLGGNIKWNFTKFLVDKDGNIVDRFSPTTTPDKIKGSIEKLL